jgi:hypothetical protein
VATNRSALGVIEVAGCALNLAAGSLLDGVIDYKGALLTRA